MAKNRLPALKKAQHEGRVLVYIDESVARRTVCYLSPLLNQTWVSKGQSPVLLEQVGRSHLSLIAAIAPNDRLYVSGQDQALCSEDVLGFLAYLCRRYWKRNLLVI